MPDPCVSPCFDVVAGELQLAGPRALTAEGTHPGWSSAILGPTQPAYPIAYTTASLVNTECTSILVQAWWSCGSRQMTMVPGNDWLVYHYARLSTASPPPGTWPQTTGDATAAGFGIFNADRHLHSGSIPGYSLQTWPASSMLLAQQILAPGQTWYGAIAVYFETASYAANNAVNQLGIPMLRVTLTGVGIA